MLDGHIKPKIDTPEVEPHGPSETYAACLKALRMNEKFVQPKTPGHGPDGLTEMAMFLDVFGPASH